MVVEEESRKTWKINLRGETIKQKAKLNRKEINSVAQVKDWGKIKIFDNHEEIK